MGVRVHLREARHSRRLGVAPVDRQGANDEFRGLGKPPRNRRRRESARCATIGPEREGRLIEAERPIGNVRAPALDDAGAFAVEPHARDHHAAAPDAPRCTKAVLVARGA